MRSLKRVFDRQIPSGLSVLREFNNGVAITEPVNLMRNLGLASIAAYCSTSYRSLNALMAMLWSIPYKLAQNISKSIPSCSSSVRQDPGGPTVQPVSQVKTTDRYADLWKRIAVNNLVPLNDYEILP